MGRQYVCSTGAKRMAVKRKLEKGMRFGVIKEADWSTMTMKRVARGTEVGTYKFAIAL